jgi:hypothetical protein
MDVTIISEWIFANSLGHAPAAQDHCESLLFMLRVTDVIHSGQRCHLFRLCACTG